jgi:hypothetical protein
MIFSLSYARQLYLLTNQTTAFSMILILKCKLIGDWSVENMIPDMTQMGC